MKKRAFSNSLTRILPFPTWGGHGTPVLFVILGVVMLFFSTVRPEALSITRSSVADMLAPALNIVNAPLQKAAALAHDASGLAALQSENARLQAENNRLREWYQSALALRAENEQLRGMLNLKASPAKRYITARVASDSGNSFVKTLLLMAGQNDGIEKGQAALSGDGLIGRVVEAGNKTARLLLVTDVNARVPVFLEGTGQNAIMAGNNTSHPVLVHGADIETLTPGTRLLTSGHGHLFPANLPVGQITHNNKGEPQIELFADFSRLIYVRILQKSSQDNAFKPAPLR